MEEPQEVFYLTSIDQARTIADPLRLRLIDYLIREPLTVTQLGERVGESPAKVHYHVRELERIGVVRLVETRESERGGILEKYYRATAKNIQLSPDLLRTSPPSEAEAMLSEWFQMLMREDMHAVARAVANPDAHEPLDLQNEYIWATNEEFKQTMERINEAVAPLRAPRSGAAVHEWSISIIAHRSRPSGEEIASLHRPPQPVAVPPLSASPSMPPEPPLPSSPTVTASSRRFTHMWVVGAVDISRQDLERAIAKGKPYAIVVLGTCRFNNDITPALIEKSIASFRHKGSLIASPEVRAALKQKGGEG